MRIEHLLVSQEAKMPVSISIVMALYWERMPGMSPLQSARDTRSDLVDQDS